MFPVPPPVLRAFQDARTILLLTHARPDGDGLGVSLALQRALRSLGKQVTVANHDAPAPRYRFLPGADEVVVSEKLAGSWDLIVVSDCGDAAQVGGIVDFRAQGRDVLALDHHIRRVPFGTLEFIEPTAAAAGELAHAVIRALGVPVDREMASCLWVSLITDTGSYQYSNTTRETLSLAGELVDVGFDFPDVSERVFNTFTERQIRLWSQALASLRLSAGGRLAAIRLTSAQLAEAGDDAKNTDGFINPVRGIEGVEVAAFFCEMSPSETKLSLRSKGKVDVASLAGTFGGGGHVRASGCTIALPLAAAEAEASSRIETLLARAGT